VVPYFDNTDHLVFVDSWVGVPGTTLTNWPDEYIHSSDDDLWQIDPTQLERNAFIVAATALWLANANANSVGPLGALVAARGAARLAADLATGLEWIQTGKGSAVERYRAATDLLAVSLETEIAALDSVRQLGPVAASDASGHGLSEQAATLRSVAKLLQAQIDRSYDSSNPGSRPPAEPDPIIQRLSARVPRLAVSTLNEWMALKKNVSDKRREERRKKRDAKEKAEALRKAGKPVPKDKAAAADDPENRLSPLMQAATMNWIDGKTTSAEIARRVCAEALSGGWWYYGETTPSRVEKFLEKQAKDGLIVWTK
jgi:hypothetical protein